MKNLRAILLLFAANTLSGISQGIVTITVSWYIANELGLPAHQSAVVILSTAIAVFWGPYAGSLIDRYDRRRIFQAINIVGVLLMGTLALIGQMRGEVTFWMAAPAFLLTIAAYNIHFPNLYAFAQEITLPAHYARITSMIEVQNQISFFVSGALASFLMEGSFFGTPIPVWSMEDVFVLDAMTYALGLIFIAGIRYTPVARRVIDTTPARQRIRRGIRFLWKNPLLLRFGIVASFVFATVLVASYWVLPMYINRHLSAGQDVFGTAEGLFAFGAMSAGLVLLGVKRQGREITGILVLMVAAVGLYLVLGFTQAAWVLIAGYGFIGFCNAGIRILRTTYIFRIVPNSIIGRTGSVFLILNAIMRIGFLSLFALPFFSRGTNVVWAMHLFALYIAAGVLFLVVRHGPLTSLRQDDLDFRAAQSA